MQTQNPNFKPFDIDLNVWAYDLLARGELDHAIAIFTLNRDLYPDDWNTWDSLGEAYQDHGDKDLTIAAYKKSLELNPDNQSGAAHLQTLAGTVS